MSPWLNGVRSWLLAEDHFYWMTSYLATRGLQRRTTSLMAAIVLGLSIIPLLLMFSDQGPTGTASRVLAVAISICCVAMAALWFRPSWPSRWQSQLCVVGGSVCAATACLIESHPALGLMGASAFIVLSAFTAFFHDGRLLAVTWVIGAATVAVLGVRLSGIDPYVTVAGIVMFVLVNVFVAAVCRNVIRLLDRDLHYGELEPLTGLLTRQAFTDRVGTLVSARDRNDDKHLAIVIVSMDSFSLLTAMNGPTGGQQARVSIGHRIAKTLRRDALLAHVGDSEFLIADTFTTSDPTVLTDRLQQTVRTAPFRLTASIGVVTTPLAPLAGLPPQHVVDELIALAADNVQMARRTGGQCTTATVSPGPARSGHDDGVDDLTA